MMNCFQISHCITRFAGNAGVLTQAATEAKKTVSELKNVLQLIWSALLEKAIDNAAKDYCK